MGKCDIPSPITMGRGLKELVGWKDQNHEHHIIKVPTTTKSPKTYEHVKETTSYWAMAKNLGATCAKWEDSLVSKLIIMKEGDTNEVEGL